MNDECPHCTTPGEATITFHGTEDGPEHDCLADVSEVTVSILDVDDKERDTFKAAVEEVKGVRRLKFPHDPILENGETISITPPLY